MGYLDYDGLETQVDCIKKYVKAEADLVREELRNRANIPIGFEYFSMNPNIPQGSLPLFGGEYSRETYSALWEWVQEQTGYLKTESDWQDLSTAHNGNVPFYSDGDGSTTFRVPSLKCWVKGANGTVTEVGSYLEAGLPNITGSLTIQKFSDGGNTFLSSSGAINLGVDGSRNWGIGWSSAQNIATQKASFDASRSSSVYGNSATVQPESIVGMWLVKAYGTIEDTGTIDEQQYIDDRIAAEVTRTDGKFLPLTGGTMVGELVLTPQISKSDWSILYQEPKAIIQRYGLKGTISGDKNICMPFGCARDESDDESSFERNRYGMIESILWADGGTNLSLKTYKNEASSVKSIQLFLDYPPSGQTNLNFNGQQVKFPAIWTSSADLLVRPTTNGTINLGNASYRWKQLFATTTTISTSDERSKENISSIPDNVLDAWGDIGWYQFQFKDAIAEKGENARIHNGVIAQRIKSVFESHGLDAFRYGLLCYDEWDAVPAECDHYGKEIRPALEAGNQYSIRYEEALCMEAAYQRRRADRLEARIEALERAING